MADDPAEVLRKVILTVTLAEFFGDDAAAIHSPTCPLCNEGPIGVVGYHQCACGNDDCPVFLWDPTDTPEQFRQKAQQIKVTRRDEQGNIVEDGDG